MSIAPSFSLDQPSQPDVMHLGGYPVLCTRLAPFADSLLQAIEKGERRRVFFANTNFVVQCGPLRQRLQSSTVTIVNDGIGLDLGAMLVHRRRFHENLNGTDLIPELCRRSPQPLRIFLLGGKPGVAEAAAATLRDALGQQVVGVCDGYAQMRTHGAGLVAAINLARPDVLLVALGNPLQERWVLDHGDQLEVPLVLGVGALLDFLSGNARRAPAWVQKLHMEWAFRLLHEPRRLIKRYSVDLLRFFTLCLRHRRGDRALTARQAG